jgi:hypothetical protein
MTSPNDTLDPAPKPIYRLVFSGELLPGFDEAQVRSALARHTERSPASLFSGKRVALAEHTDAGEAEVARQALQALGARVLVEEVEAPPPMPALGFLEVALPPTPAAEPDPKEKFAKTDSGWQPLGDQPAVLPPLDGDLSQALEPVPRAVGGLAGSAKSNPPHRPPADLSGVFGTSTALPAPVAEASLVFAPVAKTQLPTAPAAVVPAQSPQTEAPLARDLAQPRSLAQPATPDADVSSAACIHCPACGDRQPMRLLCRACGADLKRALAAQQEERAQVRATGAARAGVANKTKPGAPTVPDDGLRVLGFRVPDDWVARLTWPNVFAALFGGLLVLAAIGFLWRMLGLDPILSPSQPRPVAAVPAASEPAAALNNTAGDNSAAAASPAPLEAEVAARLSSAAAVAEFRLRYWPEPTNKVFVYSTGGVMAWRSGQPSITRAIAEALSECESRRPSTAAPCKLLNVNNYWHD